MTEAEIIELIKAFNEKMLKERPNEKAGA